MESCGFPVRIARTVDVTFSLCIRMYTSGASELTILMCSASFFASTSLQLLRSYKLSTAILLFHSSMELHISQNVVVFSLNVTFISVPLLLDNSLDALVQTAKLIPSWLHQMTRSFHFDKWVPRKANDTTILTFQTMFVWRIWQSIADY